jgi:hypothetical protein
LVIFFKDTSDICEENSPDVLYIALPCFHKLASSSKNFLSLFEKSKKLSESISLPSVFVILFIIKFVFDLLSKKFFDVFARLDTVPNMLSTNFINSFAESNNVILLIKSLFKSLNDCLN